MAVENLYPHYSFTNPASVYDEEALTTLEMCGRLARKMIECIDNINKHEKDTADYLEGQDAQIAKHEKDTADYLKGQDAQIAKLFDDLPLHVGAWLEAHPEITTTLQDGEIQEQKLHESLKNILYYQKFSELDGETDTEKLNNFLASEVGGLYLDRDITVDGIDFHFIDKFIDGRGHKIFVNGEIKPTRKYCQRYFISNCIFDGSGGGFFTLKNGENLLFEMFFTNCMFLNFTRDIFTGAEMQSFRFIHCYFDYNEAWVFNVGRADSVMVANCNCEGGNSFMKMDQCLGVTVRDSVIEGVTGTAFEFLYFQGVVLENLYLEGNLKNIVLKIVNCYQIDIKNIECYCTEGSTALVTIANLEGRMNQCVCIDNCNVHYGYVVEVEGQHKNHGLNLDIGPNNYGTNGILNYECTSAGLIKGNSLKFEIVTVKGTGTELTFTTDDFGCYANCLIGGFVTKVYDNVGRRITDPNYLRFIYNEANSFKLYGDGTKEMTYHVTLLYR